MSKEKILSDIGINLDTFQAHINKMKVEPDKLHPIDIELLRKKTVRLYEKLTELDLIVKDRASEHTKTINLPEVTPKAEIPEQIAKEKTIEKEIIADNTYNEKTEPEKVKTEKDSDDGLENLGDISDQTEQVKDYIPEAEIKVEVELPDPEDRPIQPMEQKKETTFEKTDHEASEFITPEPESAVSDNNQKTTFDLFTDSAAETLADKLGSNDEASIADKMQKSQVNDLRQAIGINEKFLFINELFNGDMGRYNKVIDELNGLETQRGIDAYLLELKVANQWPENNEAFKKLKKLLARKKN